MEFANLPEEIIIQISEYMGFLQDTDDSYLYDGEDGIYIAAVNLGLTCKSLEWILDLEAIVGRSYELIAAISIEKLGLFGSVQYSHHAEEYFLVKLSATDHCAPDNLLLARIKTANFYAEMMEDENGYILFADNISVDDFEDGDAYCRCSVPVRRRSCNSLRCRELQRAQDFIAGVDFHLITLMCKCLNFTGGVRRVWFRRQNSARLFAKLSFC